MLSVVSQEVSRVICTFGGAQQLRMMFCCTTVRGVRNTAKPAPWWVKVKHGNVFDNKTDANAEFLKDVTASIFKEKEMNSPLKSEPWPRGTWTPGSVRTGLLAKKIGCLPQWTKSGKRIHCTLLQIQDNHVISYTDPLTWHRTSRVGKKESNKQLGRLTIGANSVSPHEFTAAYRGLFEKAGVMPKEKIASFAITPNSKIQPGTRLYATHFRVGQYVDLWGRTIDHGFQGVMKRWGFAGGESDARGCTKNHRRTGSIGSREKACVWVGRKLPGRKGHVWRPLRGVKIVRINTKYQVLYLHCYGVMGNTGNYLYVKDSGLLHRLETNPVFPTHYPEEDKEPLPEEYFVDDLFDLRQPSITYDEQILPKKVTLGAKLKKQAKVKQKK